MSSRQETLARAVESSRELFVRFLAGFDEVNRTRQVPNLPNHAVWTLGHLALTMHRAAEKIDGQSLPENGFRVGEASTDFFDTESICFDSIPTDDPSRYPSLQRASAIFDAACARLAEAARSSSDATLDQELKWGSIGVSVKAADLIIRNVFHNGTHAGQLVDLRRALSLPSVIQPRP